MSYGDRLEEALQLAQADRKSLAFALGVSVQAIGQVINGKTKQHNAQNALKAAKFLKVDPGWLATGKGLPRPARQETNLSEEEADLLAAYRNVPEDFRQEVVLKVFEMAESSRKIVEKILREKYGIKEAPADPESKRQRRKVPAKPQANGRSRGHGPR